MEPVAVDIRPIAEPDWDDVRRIYADGIATGNATFETEVAEREDLEGRWVTGQVFVAVIANRVVGWTSVSPTSTRACYRGVGETSVYVDSSVRGRRVGRQLVAHQVAAAEKAGFWTLQTSIFPENVASLRIHEAAGFRVVGRRDRIAQLHGVWRDTILLEWRSAGSGS
ncbi:GNAT family N-acetyltransferase [Aeromicrobium sp. Leaf350]|uniref:GNAT family N-acetyltransferase n=1 Tax=Aeromicrobium sp. Leaf350 TaxID=2876565 RepID=UPI001E65827D|nr:GNAT family N-acetyltransferase [Aeromicrobium sp. Leaf350]